MLGISEVLVKMLTPKFSDPVN